jgi:hypothetical protein
VRDRMIPVTTCTYCDRGLTHVMRGAERQLSGMTHLTHFHLMQKEAEPEDILWGTRESLARALHDFYVQYERTHAPAGTDIGFACDWEDLPPEIRESNRRHVDSLSQWLLDEGYALDPCFDWHARPWTWSDTEAESLARQAHEWWRRERISSGWVHGPLKNVQERINPALVPWDSLTDACKERAMDFVRSYPRILANADLCIQPLLRTFEERVARAIHANYVERERARGMTPERNSSMVPWEQLPEELRASNIRQARSHFEKLQRIGCGVELLAGRMPEDLVFDAREIERLAVLEHESWRREREDAGWRWGPRKETHTRTHPCLVDWEQLPGIEKQKDRDAVMDIPRLLASAGYQVCRRSRRA